MQKIGAKFIIFLIATTFNTIALNFVRFAVAWILLRQTGQAALFALIFSISSFVEIYSKPFLSPISDYFDNLDILKICILTSSVCVFLLLGQQLLFSFSTLFLTSMLIVLSLVSGLRDPTAAGLIPALVSKDLIGDAQALRSSINATISICAPAISAIFITYGGPSFVLSMAFLLCLISAALLYAVGTAAIEMGQLSAFAYVKSWHIGIADGIRAVLLTKCERNIALAVALTNAGLFPFFSIIVPLWIGKHFQASSITMAIFETSFGTGIFIGSAFLVKRTNKKLGKFKTLLYGNGLLAVSIITMSVYEKSLFATCLFFCGGVGFCLFNINTSTLRMMATPKCYRTRMYAGVAFLSSALNPVATQFIGFLIDSAGIPTAIASCGTLILISTLILRCNEDAKMLLGRSNADVVDAYSKLYPNAFRER